jgi:ferrous iron transport protein A
MPTLDQVTLGEIVRIKDVIGSDSIAVRLMEMGLTPGCQIRFVGTAPLGDPLEFELLGYRLSLRKSEAARVNVGT